MKLILSMTEGVPAGHTLRASGKFSVDATPRDLSPDVDTGGGRESSFEEREIQGILRRPFLRDRFAKARRNTGFLKTRFLDSTLFDAEPIVDIFLDEIVGYGVFDFEILAIDPEGNEAAAAATLSVFLAPEPLGVENVTAAVASDELTLSFTHQTLEA
jgi:hypothetical protein